MSKSIFATCLILLFVFSQVSLKALRASPQSPAEEQEERATINGKDGREGS